VPRARGTEQLWPRPRQPRVVTVQRRSDTWHVARECEHRSLGIARGLASTRSPVVALRRARSLVAHRRALVEPSARGDDVAANREYDEKGRRAKAKKNIRVNKKRQAQRKLKKK
jgi:hypothetical protein